MSRSSLAIELSKLAVFTHPNPALEQHTTDSEVAATFLWDAYMAGDVQGKTIADLGSGTGILGIGCLILGASKVIFVDADEGALAIAEHSLRKLEDEEEEGFGEGEFFTVDVQEFFTPVDVVIMNPPFGTKAAGADTCFLERAFELAPTVYSMHKKSTLDYLKDFAEKHGFSITYQRQADFPLKNTMPGHSKRIEHIEVILLGMKRKQ